MRQNFFCILVSVSAYALVLADATTNLASAGNQLTSLQTPEAAAPAPEEQKLKKQTKKYYNKDGVEVKPPTCPSCGVGDLGWAVKGPGIAALVPLLGGGIFKLWTKYTETGKDFQAKENLEQVAADKAEKLIDKGASVDQAVALSTAEATGNNSQMGGQQGMMKNMAAMFGNMFGHHQSVDQPLPVQQPIVQVAPPSQQPIVQVAPPAGQLIAQPYPPAGQLIAQPSPPAQTSPFANSSWFGHPAAGLSLMEVDAMQESDEMEADLLAQMQYTEERGYNSGSNKLLYSDVAF